MTITLKNIIDEDFVNYKKPTMVICFPKCNFKCCKECGFDICQNSELSKMPNIEINIHTIVERYLNNNITSAIVCSGLEPFDSWKDLILTIKNFRDKTNDDIVIYTGYKEEELKDKITELSKFNNIIVKFGRFVPNQKSHLDNTLGIMLASDNQFALRIS